MRWRNQAEGFAILENAKRPADAILFTVAGSSGPEIFDSTTPSGLFTDARIVAGRDYEFTSVRQIKGWEYGTWTKTLDLSLLPPGEHIVEAWMLDFKHQRVWKIAGAFPLQK